VNPQGDGDIGRPEETAAAPPPKADGAKPAYGGLMLAEYEPISFVHTTDLARARQFYVGVLGLDFVEDSPFALVLRSGHTKVRVTPVESHRASPHTVLGWSVDDLGTMLDRLLNRGVRPLRFDTLDQDDRGVWRAPGGAKVAWFSDPDGNTLSLTQF